MEISSPCIFNKNYFMNNLLSNNASQSSVEIKNHYIATSVSEKSIMENDFRNNSAGKAAKKAFDITRALLILGIGVLVLFGEKFHVGVIVDLDPILKYGFGSICLLYGGFRLYRGVKGEDY